MNHPQVGIILVNFNSTRHTLECIRSLSQLTDVQYRIYLVDNGSHKQQADRLRHYTQRQPNIHTQYLPQNTGFPRANNRGIAQALVDGCRYLWVLNNDTVVTRDAATQMMQAFNRQSLETTQTVLSSMITYYQTDRIWVNGLFDLPLLNFPKAIDKHRRLDKAKPNPTLRSVPYLSGCSLFFHRDLLTVHRYFNEDYFLYFEDLDFTLATQNYVLQLPLIEHKVSASSQSHGFTPTQAYWYARGGIRFYMGTKQLTWYEQLIYLSVTVWLMAILYIRSWASLRAYLDGVRQGVKTQVLPAYKDLLLLVFSNPGLRAVLRVRFRSQIEQARSTSQSYELPTKIPEKLVVFYRISPYPSRKISPIYPQDKYKLTTLCLESFVQSFEKVRPHIVFLLDACPPAYERLVLSYRRIHSTIIPLNQLGNLASFYLQIRLACQLQDHQLTYLAEDDYYYLPEAGQQLVAFLKQAPFASLYDHPDTYSQWLLKHQRYTQTVLNGQTWRTVASTTLTFGAWVTALKATQTVWLANPFSTPSWFTLRNQGYRVYVPTPSLATHMVADHLSPLVNWKKIWQNTTP